VWGKNGLRSLFSVRARLTRAKLLWKGSAVEDGAPSTGTESGRPRPDKTNSIHNNININNNINLQKSMVTFRFLYLGLYQLNDIFDRQIFTEVDFF
jgi:hypothetical protein